MMVLVVECKVIMGPCLFIQNSEQSADGWCFHEKERPGCLRFTHKVAQAPIMTYTSAGHSVADHQNM